MSEPVAASAASPDKDENQNKDTPVSNEFEIFGVKK
jgi:hypothetical protein